MNDQKGNFLSMNNNMNNMNNSMNNNMNNMNYCIYCFNENSKRALNNHLLFFDL